jgi:hypothetical protein
VQSLAKLQAAGHKVQLLAQFPGVGSVYTPEGERIELFDETATNITFTVDEGKTDRTAERHNQKIAVPIIAHHSHLYLPEGSEAQAKAWYAKLFGAVPGMRWRYPAVDLPGINLNFSGNKQLMSPTKGRMLDHVGFEVRISPHSLPAARGRRRSLTAIQERLIRRRDGAATDPWGRRSS